MYDGIIDKPEIEDLYLSHHGILGQKWGKKNGPPYPLSSKISTGKSLKNVGSVKKKNKSKEIKSAVKAYEKQWDKSEDLENKADEMTTAANEAWKETRKLRKKIAKTPISRVYRTIKYPNDPKVKAYEKQWNKSEDLENKADEMMTAVNEAWEETRKLRKKIGKTPISRVYRTIKYGA